MVVHLEAHLFEGGPEDVVPVERALHPPIECVLDSSSVGTILPIHVLSPISHRAVAGPLDAVSDGAPISTCVPILIVIRSMPRGSSIQVAVVRQVVQAPRAARFVDEPQEGAGHGLQLTFEQLLRLNAWSLDVLLLLGSLLGDSKPDAGTKHSDQENRAHSLDHGFSNKMASSDNEC